MRWREMGDGNGYGDGDDDVDGRGVKDTTRGSKQDAWTPWHLINSMCRQGTRLYLDQGGCSGVHETRRVCAASSRPSHSTSIWSPMQFRGQRQDQLHGGQMQTAGHGQFEVLIRTRYTQHQLACLDITSAPKI